MNMSIDRAGRPVTRTLSAVAAAVATVALLAACSGGSDDDATSAPTSSETGAQADAAGGEVVVIDQTNLLLQTAQDTLETRGLTVEVVDASGDDRAIDDPTQWVVVTQDPTSGTVDSGTTVTLTVRMTTDPVS